jgi:hypothetical protein
MPLNWYGLTPQLQTRDDGPVTLEEALRRAQDCISRLQPHYASGEEALVATTFGLSHANEYFVEFCVHAPDEISLHFEIPNTPWYRALFRGRRANWRTLHSSSEVSEAIRQFFTLPPAELDTALRRAGAA